MTGRISHGQLRGATGEFAARQRHRGKANPYSSLPPEGHTLHRSDEKSTLCFGSRKMKRPKVIRRCTRENKVLGQRAWERAWECAWERAWERACAIAFFPIATVVLAHRRAVVYLRLSPPLDVEMP